VAGRETSEGCPGHMEVSRQSAWRESGGRQ